ncbi:MAG: 16S rRNA (cytosine(967)-C(5))-methyltransferase RsmB [Calditrichaeota bacterium]|nr:16S rRNA (cytosine(967)-C(5))-methyltransferase RsmB [Calditrichota bacterium]
MTHEEGNAILTTQSAKTGQERLTARRLAVRILVTAERRRAYVDLLLRSELRKSGLDHRDRALVSELVRGCVRWRLYLRWVLKKRYRGDYFRAPLELKAILELATFELFFHPSTPGYAIVSEAVELAKETGGSQWAGRVNAILRRLEPLRTQRPLPADLESARGLSIAHSHPQWLVKRWLDRYGREETVALLEANNRPAPLFVRVNTARFEVEQVKASLISEGIAVETVPGFHEYLRLEHLPQGVESLRAFREGAVTPQDPSASLAVALLQLEEGDKLWDVCAAPGGKTTAAAQLLGGKRGLVFASDLQLKRVGLIRSAAQRLGLENVRYVCADAKAPPFAAATKVLIDAPCSGTGVLRRRVDARWQRSEDDILKLQTTQLAILDGIASTVEAGGVVVYSTCTLEQEENEEVVRIFLQKHPDFSLEPATNIVDNRFTTEQGYVRTFPHRHDLDGVFAARLVRTG